MLQLNGLSEEKQRAKRCESFFIEIEGNLSDQSYLGGVGSHSGDQSSSLFARRNRRSDSAGR